MAALLAAAAPIPANNLTVTNTALFAPAAGKVAVQFDIAWDNSWRDAVTNFDACWVFVKYSTDGGSNWNHATLAANGTNPPGFTNGVGANLDIVVPADRMGAFIQRSAEGVGTVSNTGVRLWWDFATNGVMKYQSARVKVFAIEMVYVPQGGFYIGSGGSGISEFYKYPNTTDVFAITNEDAIAVGTSDGNLFYGSSVYGGDQEGPISNAFPKGYAAFYLMKTEISQRQYCDFLNTLTPNQQNPRHDSGLHFSSYRNFIKKTGGSPAFFGCDANNNAGAATNANAAKLNETNDAEWVACDYISWADGAAYADWAALRPMTELEFEKACRGPLDPVADELAWGSPTLETATEALISLNSAYETPDQGNCNYNACGYDGPYRCGSYARASSARTNAGAGYYGALDLSGSLWERAVTVGTTAGRAFTGLHGNGSVNASGDADVSGWPGSDAAGAATRGGNWYSTSDPARVSDRSRAARVNANRTCCYGLGWRGARSAP